jgi:cupin fold WbuC family metalloprotein
MKNITRGVLQMVGEVAQVSSSHLESLTEELRGAPLGRARVCVHQSPQDLVQEMLIAVDRSSYVRPHRHLRGSESLHMILGELDVIIFDSGGEITEVVSMAAGSSTKSFFYRLSAPFFHTIILHSNQAVFHEVVMGPFDPSQTEQAPWAPPVEDTSAAARYVELLRERVISR